MPQARQGCVLKSSLAFQPGIVHDSALDEGTSTLLENQAVDTNWRLAVGSHGHGVATLYNL